MNKYEREIIEQRRKAIELYDSLCTDIRKGQAYIKPDLYNSSMEAIAGLRRIKKPVKITRFVKDFYNENQKMRRALLY